uniref:DENN domain-containing protein n=1 Tax=Macrostomum lignano TaxID=282301 RepID=A0A1I8JSC8_9PLAT
EFRPPIRPADWLSALPSTPHLTLRGPASPAVAVSGCVLGQQRIVYGLVGEAADTADAHAAALPARPHRVSRDHLLEIGGVPGSAPRPGRSCRLSLASAASPTVSRQQQLHHQGPSLTKPLSINGRFAGDPASWRRVLRLLRATAAPSGRMRSSVRVCGAVNGPNLLLLLLREAPFDTWLRNGGRRTAVTGGDKRSWRAAALTDSPPEEAVSGWLLERCGRGLAPPDQQVSSTRKTAGFLIAMANHGPGAAAERLPARPRNCPGPTLLLMLLDDQLHLDCMLLMVLLAARLKRSVLPLSAGLRGYYEDLAVPFAPLHLPGPLLCLMLPPALPRPAGPRPSSCWPLCIAVGFAATAAGSHPPAVRTLGGRRVAAAAQPRTPMPPLDGGGCGLCGVPLAVAVAVWRPAGSRLTAAVAACLARLRTAARREALRLGLPVFLLKTLSWSVLLVKEACSSLVKNLLPEEVASAYSSAARELRRNFLKLFTTSPSCCSSPAGFVGDCRATAADGCRLRLRMGAHLGSGFTALVGSAARVADALAGAGGPDSCSCPSRCTPGQAAVPLRAAPGRLAGRRPMAGHGVAGSGDRPPSPEAAAAPQLRQLHQQNRLSAPCCPQPSMRSSQQLQQHQLLNQRRPPGNRGRRRDSRVHSVVRPVAGLPTTPLLPLQPLPPPPPPPPPFARGRPALTIELAAKPADDRFDFPAYRRPSSPPPSTVVDRIVASSLEPPQLPVAAAAAAAFVAAPPQDDGGDDSIVVSLMSLTVADDDEIDNDDEEVEEVEEAAERLRMMRPVDETSMAAMQQSGDSDCDYSAAFRPRARMAHGGGQPAAWLRVEAMASAETAAVLQQFELQAPVPAVAMHSVWQRPASESNYDNLSSDGGGVGGCTAAEQRIASEARRLRRLYSSDHE